VFMNSTSSNSISNTTNTAIAFDTLESAGGSSSNWGAFSSSSSLYTIPAAGMYDVTLQTVWASGLTAPLAQWCEVNNSGTPGSQRGWGQQIIQSTSGSNPVLNSNFKYKFAANDTIQPCVWQSSGGTQHIYGGGGCKQIL
jgi:hypothetical protein